LIFSLLTDQVNVSASPSSTQNREDIFPEPQKFDPGRWMVGRANSASGAELGTSEMRDAFLAFGKGHRACMGKLMAQMNLRIWTATVLTRLRVRLADEKQSHKDMEHSDHFALMPKGKKCIVVFEEI
jgi:cytochrome P450